MSKEDVTGIWNDADEVEGLVGRSSNLNRITADRPLRIVQRLFEVSCYINRSMIEVNGSEVILHLPAQKRKVILSELESARLLQEVTVLPNPTLPSAEIGVLTRRCIQKELFPE